MLDQSGQIVCFYVDLFILWHRWSGVSIGGGACEQQGSARQFCVGFDEVVVAVGQRHQDQLGSFSSFRSSPFRIVHRPADVLRGQKFDTQVHSPFRYHKAVEQFQDRIEDVEKCSNIILAYHHPSIVYFSMRMITIRFVIHSALTRETMTDNSIPLVVNSVPSYNS